MSEVYVGLGLYNYLKAPEKRHEMKSPKSPLIGDKNSKTKCGLIWSGRLISPKKSADQVMCK